MKSTPEQREQWQQKNWKASDLSDLVTALYVVCIDLEAAERELAETRKTYQVNLATQKHNYEVELRDTEKRLRERIDAAEHNLAAMDGENDSLRSKILIDHDWYLHQIAIVNGRNLELERELAEQRERAEIAEAALRIKIRRRPIYQSPSETFAQAVDKHLKIELADARARLDSRKGQKA